MTIPIPAIIIIFLIAAIVGAAAGAPWYSILGIASPSIMGAMLMFERRSKKKVQ